mmetsp:Transcript_378/g.388  ORF Transcript_378/g.388 Transcript_378/m.388 type:complete len:92 (-) Transcript_378:15-290(-)
MLEPLTIPFSLSMLHPRVTFSSRIPLSSQLQALTAQMHLLYAMPRALTASNYRGIPPMPPMPRVPSSHDCYCYCSHDCSSHTSRSDDSTAA